MDPVNGLLSWVVFVGWELTEPRYHISRSEGTMALVTIWRLVGILAHSVE
jgi:hypothetical protein